MAERQKSQWPENAAMTVQDRAEEYGHQSALNALAMIRDTLFGNAGRMEELAAWWGQAPYMAGSEMAIDEPRNNLAEHWQGEGYDTYTTYAINAAERISRNKSVFDEIAATCESCLDIVYETYVDAIALISSCADEIAETSVDFLEDVINPFAEAAKVVQILNRFVRRVGDLIEAAVRRMGELRQSGVFLARQANDFSDVGVLAEAGGNAGLWAVKPVPEEPAAAR